MARIRVAVTGALGRMGREVIAAVARQPDMAVVGGVVRTAGADHLTLPTGGSLPLVGDLATLVERAPVDVVVDFSQPAATPVFARAALPRGVALVVGTSGLGEDTLAEMRALSHQHKVGVVVGPNFGIGGVVLTHLCRIAAPFFAYAEIVEMHREGKADAPSGTSLAIARALVAARGGPFAHNVPQHETIPGTRGGELGGVAIHSVRSPGAVGVHEVIFGGPGESLVVRHDSLTRESFTPGVLLAVREVLKRREFIYGLEALLGLAG